MHESWMVKRQGLHHRQHRRFPLRPLPPLMMFPSLPHFLFLLPSKVLQRILRRRLLRWMSLWCRRAEKGLAGGWTPPEVWVWRPAAALPGAALSVDPPEAPAPVHCSQSPGERPLPIG